MVITTASQSDSYPTLTEMGVMRPNEISSYSLRSYGKRSDVLKIRYKRRKGSFLPQSRTHKFGRSLTTVVADGGTARIENSYEISPFLLRALTELDSLVQPTEDSSESHETSTTSSAHHRELLAELNALEAMLTDDTVQTNPSAVSARFDKLRAQVEAL